ncbi:SDR family oxidoreductase [Rosenbergiella epipactidis]|uniref:SDR family oxidoreductase n=1 Tax=Rosenbergiella epipactidis TaxID=1544694 RepID=UPI000664549D|nr:SDR family oxidoreductase [Rosenbergiella epipactidis]KMV73553.1 short-chain dehydrogenase [bacteria symbiont BFo2 of Frankliniella occidentalis]KYP96172.1 short-chain dehydrogenase [bacteria symbiont BFo2 of Frankliniella occidentalis]
MASNQTILIIGASRGIGLGLVEQFSAQGWQVTATYRGTPVNNSSAQWLALDITDSASQQQFIEQLADQRFAAIVINAGVFGPAEQRVDLASDAQLHQLFLTNSFAPVRLAQRLLPYLVPQSGVLAFTSSQMASLTENPAAEMPLYAASKAALNMLVRALHPAAQQAGITLLSLHPGWVQTDMGGDHAPVTVEQSSSGLKQVIITAASQGGHHYLDYQGQTLDW